MDGHAVPYSYRVASHPLARANGRHPLQQPPRLQPFPHCHGVKLASLGKHGEPGGLNELPRILPLPWFTIAVIFNRSLQDRHGKAMQAAFRPCVRLAVKVILHGVIEPIADGESGDGNRRPSGGMIAAPV